MESIDWSQLLMISFFNFCIGVPIGMAFVVWDKKREDKRLDKDLKAFREEYARARREVDAANDAYYKRFGR
jgi:uncharacterized membrane protein YccC